MRFECHLILFPQNIIFSYLRNSNRHFFPYQRDEFKKKFNQSSHSELIAIRLLFPLIISSKSKKKKEILFKKLSSSICFTDCDYHFTQWFYFIYKPLIHWTFFGISLITKKTETHYKKIIINNESNKNRKSKNEIKIKTRKNWK